MARGGDADIRGPAGLIGCEARKRRGWVSELPLMGSAGGCALGPARCPCSPGKLLAGQALAPSGGRFQPHPQNMAGKALRGGNGVELEPPGRIPVPRSGRERAVGWADGLGRASSPGEEGREAVSAFSSFS